MNVLAIAGVFLFCAGLAQTDGQRPPNQRWPACTTVDGTKLDGAALDGTDLISELDACVKRRFANFDAFGARRIMTLYQHSKYSPTFTPESERELEVACALQSSHTDVAIFVAGRGALGYEGKVAKRWASPEGNHGTLSDPIRLTGTFGRSDLPDASVLKRVVAAAFRVGNAEETSGDWTVRGSTVIATDTACVTCHNGENRAGVPQPTIFPAAPRLGDGDAIGVALYVARVRR